MGQIREVEKGTKNTLLTTVSERFLIVVVIQSESAADLLPVDVGVGGRSCCARLLVNFPLELDELAVAAVAVVEERWRVVALRDCEWSELV